MDTGEAADELYALTPDQFTARRTELAAQAKREGDPATAKEIGKLRRPTVSAWTVNVLVTEDDDALAELLEVAEALRHAQADLDASRMSELSTRRRALVQRVQRQSAAAARTGGQSLSAAGLREVEETMAAAVASAEAADAVASGRLTRALSYAGFGEVDLSEATALAPRPAKRAAPQQSPAPPTLRLVESPPAGKARKATPGGGVPARSAGEREAEAAEQQVKDARAAVERTSGQLAAAREATAEQARLVHRLQEELSAARAAAAGATRAETTAERRHASAEVNLSNAERRLRAATRSRRS